MLKELKKNDTLVTPYIATKDWQLSNTANEDIIFAENGNTVAIESIQYTNTNAISVNSNCFVAIENQSLDLATIREGLKISGFFYPGIDPINNDGTYKRLIYSQISNMFYNHYRDPTKIWGTEQIDFDTSQTKRYLSDLFKLLDIPTEIFGEKIVKGSVEIIDNTLDDATIITDDSFNNLFAGPNLFSKRQELGNHSNIFQTGSSGICNEYFNFS